MIIRELTKEDLPFLLEVRNECRHFLHDPREFTLEECQAWFEKERPDFYILQVNGESIGYFRTSDWTEDSVFIGLDIHKDYRGKGFAIPAYRMFIGMLNMPTYFLRVLKTNIRAIHIYNKLGFEIVGEDEDSLDMMLCN